MNCKVCGVGLVKAEETIGICNPCNSGKVRENSPASLEEQAARIEAARRESELIQNKIATLMLTTEALPQGITITKRIDIITAECAFGMNFFRDLFAQVTDIFGGRSESTQKVLRDARKKVLHELRREAHDLGANAVVSVTLNYSEFSGQGKSMLFVVACGTAVIVEN